jgi:hypothetical protein
MDFSSETIKDRRQYKNILKLLTEKNYPPKIHLTKMSVKNKGKTDLSSYKDKLRKSVTCRYAFKELLNKVT